MPARMPVNQKAIGKRWPPVSFDIDADRIDQYATAVGEANPIYHDAGAAREAGFRDLVAPPMFCVVYSATAMGPAILDPEIGMNFATMVHGGQEFEWGEPVCAGDVISTTVSCKDISERNGMGFYVFESVSTNQEEQETVRGTWTNIVRGV
jgi:acyl dehydratase